MTPDPDAQVTRARRTARITLAIMLVGVAGELLFAPMGGEAGQTAEQLSAHQLAVAGITSSAALACLALAGALGRRGPVSGNLLLGRAPRPLGAVRTLIVVLGMLGLSQLLDLAVDIAEVRPGSALERIDGAVARAADREVPLVALGVALGPGVAEELLFRGLLLGAIARYAGPTAGIVGSALLFGLLHLDAVQGSAAAVLGLYLALVVVVSGGLGAAILCHVANNLLALAHPFATSRFGATAPWADVGLLTAGGLSLLLAVWRLRRALPEALADWQRIR